MTDRYGSTPSPPTNAALPTAASAPAPSALPRPDLGIKGLAARDFSMAIALVIIWSFFACATHMNFLSARNLSNLSVELSVTAVLALGALLIIVAGHIDLSIGSGVGLFGGVAAVLITLHHWNAGAAMLLAVVLAVIVWLAMGTLIVTERIPAFIITLAGLLIFRGLHWLVIQNASVPVAVGGQSNLMSILTTWYLPALGGWILATLVILAIGWGSLNTRRRRREFGFSLEPASVGFSKFLVLGQLVAIFVLVCNQYRGLPLSALILALTALCVAVLTKQTRFGRYLYAIGSNEEAAVVSGVPVRNVVIATFGIMGFLVALGGFMQTAYASTSTTTIGELLELDAIAACVIGGTSLRGGRGTVLGVIFGALIMASLVNGMTLMALSPATKLIARGTVLALAVWLDVRLARA
jgi:D-xylose transport system permease protein